MSTVGSKLRLLNPALFALAVLLPTTAIASTAIASEPVESSTKINDIAQNTDAILPAQPSPHSQPPVIANTNNVQTPSTPSVSDLADEAQNDDLGQVTSVSQLSDVQPDDWAFQAIQSLVERYGCVAGYPNGTFRPNRAMSRREAAALVNACLDNLSNRFATKEDLDALKALQDEFAAELATLRGRVDGLEARTATIEAQQFATQTKLNGEIIFGAGIVLDEGVADLTGDAGEFEEDRPFLAGRVRLNFDTSFNGEDRLRVRLESSNIAQLDDSTNLNQARLGFDGNDDELFDLNELNYTFKPVDNLTVKIDANAGGFEDNVDTVNPFLASSGDGALSRFSRFNPIFQQGGGGVGATAVLDITERAAFAVGYLADEGDSATGLGEDIDDATGGLFSGSNAALAQLTVEPVERVQVGLTYVRAFDEAGNVDVTGDTAGDAQAQPFTDDVDTTADHFGFQTSIQAADWVNFSGWVGYTLARTSNDADPQSADLLNWNASLQFPDLGGEGNLGYVSFGQPFEIISTDGGFVDPDNAATSYQIEGGYRFAVNDNIAITPGVIVILNPDNNAVEENIVIPVIRTTFKF